MIGAACRHDFDHDPEKMKDARLPGHDDAIWDISGAVLLALYGLMVVSVADRAAPKVSVWMR